MDRIGGECGVVRGWGYIGNGCVSGCRLIENVGWICWSNRKTTN